MPIFDIEIIASDSTPGPPADLAQSLADAAAENTHILYQPDGAGRVSFGGKLVR